MVHPSALQPIVGGDKYGAGTRLWCEPPSGIETYYKEAKMATLPHVGYELALETADYLIVTSPKNLLLLNPKADVDQLLSTMAELARLKNGALGFLDVPAALHRDYDTYDGLGVGDLTGDGREEIVVGSIESDRVFVYGIVDEGHWYGTPGSEFTLRTWAQHAAFKCGSGEQGFEQGDRIAVGLNAAGRHCAAADHRGAGPIGGQACQRGCAAHCTAERCGVAVIDRQRLVAVECAAEGDTRAV